MASHPLAPNKSASSPSSYMGPFSPVDEQQMRQTSPADSGGDGDKGSPSTETTATPSTAINTASTSTANTAISTSSSFSIDAGIESHLAQPQAESPLPAFLRQSKSQIHSKFVDLEWQQRERLHRGLQNTEDPTGDRLVSPSQWARITGDEINKRNRYMNVDPFASNRVRLKVPEGHCDYINASPIKLKLSDGTEKYFIATQGPKEGSYNHMWRMINDETADPAVIIMLTQTHESGRERCFPYFPTDQSTPELLINSEDEFGDGFAATLRLKSMVDDDTSRSTVRELELQDTITTIDTNTNTKAIVAPHTASHKTVWHLLFGAWPDFLVPEGEDRQALQRLIRMSDEKNLHKNSPRIVHCSAGVGRSGTFIALDYLMSELELGAFDKVAEDSDPIADLVDRLREQRMMMVQGEQQFWFLYEILRELWLERWNAGNS